MPVSLLVMLPWHSPAYDSASEVSLFRAAMTAFVTPLSFGDGTKTVTLDGVDFLGWHGLLLIKHKGPVLPVCKSLIVFLIAKTTL